MSIDSHNAVAKRVPKRALGREPNEAQLRAGP
jgi:hypothetical protein